MRLVLLCLGSVAACALAACDQPLTLGGSCGGSHSSTCEPYAFSEVASATIEPAALRPGQLAATAHVHVELRTCASMSPAHTVRLLARTSTGTSVDDAGTDGTVYMLGMVADDGTNGDALAGDGIIDATIGNPFTSHVPGESALTVTFTPHAEPHCDGTSFDLAYTTGPTYTVMPTP